MLDRRLASFDQNLSNRDLEIVNNNNLAARQHLVQPQMLSVTSSRIPKTATSIHGSLIHKPALK